MVSKNEVMMVSLDSCWDNEKGVNDFKKKMNEKYNLKADFYDGGDHNSFWTLTGFKEDIIKAIVTYWNAGGTDDMEQLMYDLAPEMDKETFEKLFDKKYENYWKD